MLPIEQTKEITVTSGPTSMRCPTPPGGIGAVSQVALDDIAQLVDRDHKQVVALVIAH